VITCAEAMQQLWEYLDDAVSDADRAALDEHLTFCRRCCGEAEFAEELRAFLAGQEHEELPSDIRARLLHTLEQLGSP
jgi:mycothiol system anti-sigma-R factor